VEAIRIEGVWFRVEDAREFAKRAQIYGETEPWEFGPAKAFALSIEICIKQQGAFDLRVSPEKKTAVVAILEEWLQNRDAPDATGTLYRALTSVGSRP
jgi:hypothetical protein